jgi:hypothetical protein
MDRPQCKCGAMAEEVVSGTDSFANWKRQTDAQLNSIRSEGVSGGVPTDGEQRLLANISSDIEVIKDCINRKNNCISTLGTTNSTSQETILHLKEQIVKEKEGIEIAKQRVSYVRAPATKTSFYQGWFPIDRPLKAISIPILSGFTFFFAVLSIGALLLNFKIHMKLFVPGWATDPSKPKYWVPNKIMTALPNAAIQERYKQIQQEAARRKLQT